MLLLQSNPSFMFVGNNIAHSLGNEETNPTSGATFS